jgi:uncharacterized protein
LFIFYEANDMKLLIISDTHDHIADLQSVISATKGKIDAVIHCGDFCAPFSIRALTDFGVPVHCVWGNTNDKDGCTSVSKSLKQVKIYGDVAELLFDKLRFHVNHYPEIGMAAAMSGKYDVVLYGHTHTQYIGKMAEALVINPGPVMGEAAFDSAEKGPRYVILDTKTFEIFAK